VWGIRTLARKNKSATVALVVGLVLAIVFYGVGTVNYGTGMRHRQMFTWIIFLFGGIGIAEHVNFRGLPYASTPPENDYRDKNG
jgi:ABC-type cobalamin transport system permease subunit